MKKNLLLFCLSFFSILVMGQKNVKELKSARVSEFMNHIYVSTSDDANTLLELDSLWAADINLEDNLTTRTKAASKLKSASQKKSLIDTAYTFPWISSTQKWDTIPTGKIIYTYDTQYNLTNYLSLTWNATSLSWQNSIQITYIYDTSNQLMSALQQNWKNKGRGIYAWVNNNKKSWTYDSLERKSNFFYQTWNTNKNKWIDSWQHDFFYDSIGNNTKIIENIWNASLNSWVLNYMYLNHFDSLSRIILNPVLFWSDTSWVNIAQTVYNYDLDGNKTSILYQSWNNGSAVWENAELDSTYYLKPNQIEKSNIKLWDTTSMDWYYVRQCTYEYDSIGNNTSILSQDYDLNNYYWYNSSKNVYEYDSLKTQISSGVLSWDFGAEKWYSGTLTKLTITYYNSLKSGFIKQSDKTDLKKETPQIMVEIFPNPARDFVNIQNNVSVKQIQVFDMLGNEMLLKNYSGLISVQLDIANLKSGVYFLIMRDSNGMSTTKKIMKQ